MANSSGWLQWAAGIIGVLVAAELIWIGVNVTRIPVLESTVAIHGERITALERCK